MANRLYADSLDVQLPPYRAAQNYEPRSQKTNRAGSGTLVVPPQPPMLLPCSVTAPFLRQRTPQCNGCAGIQRDAGERKYISLEGGGCARESRSCRPPAKICSDRSSACRSAIDKNMAEPVPVVSECRSEKQTTHPAYPRGSSVIPVRQVCGTAETDIRRTSASTHPGRYPSSCPCGLQALCLQVRL